MTLAMQSIPRRLRPGSGFAAWIVASALIGTLGACASSGPASGGDSAAARPSIISRAMDWIDTKTGGKPVVQEIADGTYQPSGIAIGEKKDLAQRRGQLYGIVPEAALAAFANRVRANLLKPLGVTKVPGAVYLVGTPELNAVSTADGNIFLSIAWFERMTSEDQLAALIAHELAHVLLKHHGADLFSRYHKQLVSAWQLGIGIRADFETRRVSAAEKERLERAELSIRLNDLGLMPAWGRRQEEQADALATDLLVKAGYSHNAMVECLEMLKEFDEATRKSEKEVAEELEELAKQGLAESFKAGLKRLIATVSASHPSPQARIESVVTYQDRHYAETLMPEPRDAAFRKAVAPARAVVDNYRSSYASRRLLLEKKKAESLPPAQSGIRSPTQGAVYPNWVAYLAASANGRRDDAFAALERAYRNPEDPVNAVYQEYSEALGRRHRYREALAVVERAQEVFDNSAEWLPPRIRWLSHMGRRKEARQLAADCGLKHPEQRDACQVALDVRASRAQLSQ